MSAWSTIIYNKLVAGTWSNYGECPTIIILYKGSIRVRGTYILLEDDDEEPTSDHKGKILMSLKSGILSIYSGNETNRDNIRKDVEAILLASNLSFEIIGANPSIPQKNVYLYEMNINVLD